MKRILIIGPIDNAHVCRLITNIKHNDKENELIFDGFNINVNERSENPLFNQIYNINRKFWNFLYKIKGISTLCTYIDIIICFCKINCIYNYCNIHFPTVHSAILFPFLRKKSKEVIISPWGSDVYRIRKKDFYIVKKLYGSADHITVPPIRFRDDIQKKFDVPSSKIVNLGFGSEIIDELISTNNTKEQAKAQLNIHGKYVITCGYNGSQAQNHLPILNALIQVKKLLPPNTIILLPMTYMRHDLEYIKRIKNLLKENNLEHIVYESYLTNSEIADIRLATDIFIHIQNTDAYSATLQEFLFTDTTVFNGNWTRYPNLETNGIPYILVNDLEDINNRLILYFKKKITCQVSEECKKIVKELSWANKGKEWFEYLKS